MNSKKEYVVGIDLGTTTTVASVYDTVSKQSYNIDVNGLDYIPSVVQYEIINGKAIATKVGIDAINNAPSSPKNTIFNSKRFFGLTSEDIHQKVEKGQSNRILTYKHLEETTAKSYRAYVDNGKVMIEIIGPNNTKVAITPVDVSVAILQTCKKFILKHFNIENENDVTISAVITVPAYFNNHQREEVKNAGAIAGYNVLRIINEPTAAALSRSEQLANVKNLLVVDLGGGTFDVSLLNAEKIGDMTTLEVKATEGHLALGGSDFDNAIADWILSELSRMGLKDQAGNDINIKNNPESLARLAEVAEKTKKMLSNNEQSVINLSSIDYRISTSKTLILTRNRFNDLISPQLKEIQDIVQKVLKETDIKKEDMVMLLTGGSTRVPAVYELLKGFGIKLLAGNRPDGDVSFGASKLASGLVKGGSSDVLLIDVTPLTLGIETVGGISTSIIDKNTSIPTTATKVFSTAEDNQTVVSIHVVQGERTEARNNRSLGRFDLSGIPPAPRGVPVIEITFKLDADGIVHVSAKEKNTGKEATITIQGKISDEERQAMVDAANSNKEYDEKIAKNAQLRNAADNKVYEARKVLKEQEGKIDEELKTEILTLADALEEALRQSSDIATLNYDDINNKSDSLSNAMMKIYEKMNAKSNEEAKTSESTEEETTSEEK